MRKLLTATLIIAALASSAPLLQFVRAQTVDLGVENVGLFPSNPFYFLKEWGRGVRKFFIANAVRKAELELEIVNEKAAELEKLAAIAPNNKTGIAGALNNYSIAAANLTARLDSFTETTANPDVARLVNAVVRRALLHQHLFDTLIPKFYKDAEILGALDSANRGLTEALAKLVSGVDDPAEFRIRVATLANSGAGAWRSLPAIELAQQISALTSGSA